jgi:tetraacyldisaccharide 4'-kinase
MTTANNTEAWLQAIWYGRSPLAWLLLPFSWLFLILVKLRALFYRWGLLKVIRVDVPVIVVGNVTVGGTGKTPITIWLCEQLTRAGYQPGVVSRGYGANPGATPTVVFAASDTSVVGDESVLIAKRTGCPVVVHPDRVAAATALLALDVDIILADDGLQHRRLERDYEIVVVDGDRGFGNGFLLPAGPLREPLSRLRNVDQVLEQFSVIAETSQLFRREEYRETIKFRLNPTVVRSIDDSEARSILDFSGERVHAIAAIGNPQRFFRTLKASGIEVIEHAMRDHAELTLSDITFSDDLPVVMTEKDAVKCRDLGATNCWYVSVDVEFQGGKGEAWFEHLMSRIAPERQV